MLIPLGTIVLSVLGCLGADDWPQFAGPNSNNTSGETGLTRTFPETGPPVLWTVDIADGYSGAAVRDDRVFLVDRAVGEKDILRVFDFETGDELWRFEHEVDGRLMFPGARSTPTVTDSFVYVQGGFGNFYCVRREDHTLAWSADMTKDFGGMMPMFGYANSPLVIDNMVVLSPMGMEAGLVALDRKTGEELWRTPGIGTSHSTPSVIELMGEPQIIMISATLDMAAMQEMQESTDPPPRPPPGMLKAEPADNIIPEEMADMTMPGKGSIFSFSLSGELLWQTDDYYCSSPIPTPLRVNDNHFFVTGGYDAGSVLYRLDQAEEDSISVQEVFRHEKGAQIHLPIFHEGHFYVLANENSNDPRPRRDRGGLMCLDMKGEVKWRTGAEPYFGRGAMIMADGLLLIQDGLSGTLRLVEPSPEKYKPIAEANVFGIRDRRDHQMWSPMAIADGRLLMRSQSQLKCLNIKAQ